MNRVSRRQFVASACAIPVLIGVKPRLRILLGDQCDHDIRVWLDGVDISDCVPSSYASRFRRARSGEVIDFDAFNRDERGHLYVALGTGQLSKRGVTATVDRVDSGPTGFKFERV